jgi:hypothetical protein
MKTQPKPFTGSDLKSCQEPGAQEQVGGNPPAGCDAVRVRRPESLQVGKMADSSGRVGKSGGSGAGKGAVSAEQVRSRERTRHPGRCRIRVEDKICGSKGPLVLSTVSMGTHGGEGVSGGDHEPF